MKLEKKKKKPKCFYFLGYLLGNYQKKSGDLETPFFFFFFGNLANLGHFFHGKSFV
jgi:hypothetical protein